MEGYGVGNSLFYPIWIYAAIAGVFLNSIEGKEITFIILFHS